MEAAVNLDYNNCNLNRDTLIESAIVVDDAAEVVLAFDKLEALDIHDESLVSRIKLELQAGSSKDWRAQFSGIESVRRLLKFHGDQVNAIYAMFGAEIAGIFACNRTSLVKGVLALLSETFTLASTYALHTDILRVFMKALLKKLTSNSTLKALNEWIKYVIVCFVDNAFSYDAAFTCLLEEPAATWHRKPDAILILESLIKNRVAASSLTTLQEATFVEITRFLFAGVQQPKGTKKVALDCFVTILKSIGEQNFVSLMNYSLQ